MSTRRILRTATIAAGLLLAAVVPIRATAQLDTTSAALRADTAPAGRTVIPPEARDDVLASGWRQSTDMAWTTSGDATGFHLFVAYERTGYAWRNLASLREPGVETDRWIGNVCFTASGKHAVVVYAPRAASNRAQLFQRAGFTAVVDVATGAVTKLPVLTTLAYFNPGCGDGEAAVLSQSRGGEIGDTVSAATRLFVVDTITGALSAPTQVEGQITSPIPVGGGIIAAAGRRIVAVEGPSHLRTIATTAAVPFRLVADKDGGVVFMDHAKGTGYVRYVPSTTGLVRPRELARGELTSVNLLPGTAGRAFITGAARVTGTLPTAVAKLDVPRTAEVSSAGRLAILHADDPDGERTLPMPSNIDEPTALELDTRIVPTGNGFEFATMPGVNTMPAMTTTSSADAPVPSAPLAAPAASPLPGMPGPIDDIVGTADDTAAPAAAKDPIDRDATCAVPRNDARSQVYQPTPRQVEWASDEAVVNNLLMTRPANWKQSGLPAWTPQGMFPSISLTGGGRVNVQVLLGIFAQESNLWQASGHALSGVAGNPLIGNFYGRNLSDGDPNNDWDVDFSQADCGYGISQITDGMRKAGSERPGEVALPADYQRAAALDYATNIAAGLRILQQKWNETKAAGVVHSNGDPKWVENWFMAAWAYNSGFHPNMGDGSPWGVGWFNNPANPIYPANRGFFNRNPNDPAHPQDWPYPEKVMGWAAYSIATVDGAGFRTAWWVSVEARDRAKPPIYTFCTAANTCEPGASYTPNSPDVIGSPAGPCAHKDATGSYDLKCWWHDPVEFNWCGSGYCGNELWRFDTTYPEQPDGTHYPPNCQLAGLPAGARIVDDVADNVGSVRPNCGHPWTNAGTFTLRFGSDAVGRYPSKVDFHQIGGGFGGHFWFAHTRTSDSDLGGKMKVTGKWTFDTPMTSWGRVLVHMPDHGAHTQQARYVVNLGDGTTKTRFLLQRTLAHKWVSLGVMKFNGKPSITLATETYDGRGSEDVAWDAVAIEPLPAKPANFIVAIGDSYASGEGASDPTDGDDYYKETDNNGQLDDNMGRNACHRSPFAWTRLGWLSDNASTSLGNRADGWDQSLDFQMHSCSGARTHNMIPYYTATPTQEPRNAFGLQGRGQYGEMAQIDKGYLDENTTLVTFSIGGNDARFTDIIKECIYAAGLVACPDAKLSGESEPMKVTVPRDIDGRVRDSVLLTLREIHSRAPNAKIVMAGYPRLLENDGQCIIGIGTEEAPWLNEMADRLNTMLSGVAIQGALEGIQVWFSNPTEEFGGKAICGNPESIHGIVENTTAGDKPKTLGLLPPSSQSFHPKTTGTPLYADSFNSTLRQMGL